MKKILLPLVALLFTFSSFAQDVKDYNGTIKSDVQISVYPNPADDFIIVNNIVELGVKEIEVFDILTSKVKITFTSGLRNSIKLDLTRLSSGIYFVRFFNAKGVPVAIKKIKII